MRLQFASIPFASLAFSKGGDGHWFWVIAVFGPIPYLNMPSSDQQSTISNSPGVRKTLLPDGLFCESVLSRVCFLSHRNTQHGHMTDIAEGEPICRLSFHIPRNHWSFHGFFGLRFADVHRFLPLSISLTPSMLFNYNNHICIYKPMKN